VVDLRVRSAEDESEDMSSCIKSLAELYTQPDEWPRHRQSKQFCLPISAVLKTVPFLVALTAASRRTVVILLHHISSCHHVELALLQYTPQLRVPRIC
jgi:hypothetical protein